MKKYKDTLYTVSEDGLVFRQGKLKSLKPDRSPKGYKRVTLCHEGKLTRLLIHRMVAETYIPNPLSLPYINHKDNCPDNNSVENLEWVTHSENMLHSHSQGRCSNLLASAEASRLHLENSNRHFKALLGDSFVGIECKSPRIYVEFLCQTCGKAHKSRSDSSIFSADIFRCISCIRKMKI